jgi:methyl-accepting chemotaxis protein
MNACRLETDRSIIVFGAGGLFLAAAGGIVAALMAAGKLPSTASIILLVLCTGAFVLGLIAFLKVRHTLGSFRTLAGAAGSKDDEERDLGALLNACGCNDPEGPGQAIAHLFCAFNDDIVALQRSAKKFDLFSSDILFSAQNLAGQSSRQLDMLGTLRERTGYFFDTMTKTSGKLAQLKDTVNGNAASSNALRQRALSSKQDLTSIMEQTRATARNAKAGVEEVEATGSAALELERGLQNLNRTAMRESEEARSIGESIRTIADIVERTHILATNASIEAARAGERGAGFAVIAQEVRKLSASSKVALEEVDRVLRSVKSGIDESTAMVTSVAASAAKLGGFLSKTRETFNGIGSDVLDIEKRIDRFDGIFSEQIDGASNAASFAEKTAGTLEGFAADYKNSAADYETIVASTKESETYATDSKRSARLLAQLASYLKAGGAERNRILRHYKADPEASQRKFGRKERREDLLYNLEVFNSEGALMGHLGDLSRSGLQLLSSVEYPADSTIELTIALPITSEGERRLALKVIVRRSEKDVEGFRLGCSIDSGDIRLRAIVDEILRTLSLGGLAAPGADMAAGLAPASPGYPASSIAPGADYEDTEEIEEAEEVEEL